MKIIFLIFCMMLSSSIMADGIQNYLETAAGLFCDGLQNYEVVYSPSHYDVVYSPSDAYAYLQSHFYIIKSSNDSKYEILDSLQTRFVCAGDTNVVIYESRDDVLSYLLAITLSPKITYDTLIAIGNKDYQNWISKIDKYLKCSIRDSVILYDHYESNIYKGCRIIKIMPENGWKEIISIRNCRNTNMLWDFSRFLICTCDSLIKGDFPPYRLFIYDIALDSLYQMKELGRGILRAIKRFSHSDLHYLQCIGEDCNVWKLTPDGGKFKLTNEKPPYYVFEFSLDNNILHYNVLNRNNRDYEMPKLIKLED